MPTAPDRPTILAWLDAGLPITLLYDLAEPDGPDSLAINAAERPAGDPVWDEAATERIRLRLLG